MEEFHLVVPSLTAFAGPGQGMGWNRTALFGVMDGHGGGQVARFCQRHLPTELVRNKGVDIGGALVTAFERMDEMLSSPQACSELAYLMPPQDADNAWAPAPHPDHIGTTAFVTCVTRDALIVANAGDSRAVLCRMGNAVDMSWDHKPAVPSELARIQRAGGYVLERRIGAHVIHRVNGDLSLSRSIGDLQYKRNPNLPAKDQVVSCTPDVQTFRRQPGDEFMLIGCDGVWDVLSSQQAVDFVRPQVQRILAGQIRPSTVVEAILDRCVSPDLTVTEGLGGDNMTLVLVVFAAETYGPAWPQNHTHSKESGPIYATGWHVLRVA